MSNHPTPTIRSATPADAGIIARHRVAMFREMGQIANDGVAAVLLAESVTAIFDTLRDGSYLGWLAVDEGGRVVAGAGAHIKPQLPRVDADGLHVVTGPGPLVVNVYTEPEWRHRGVGRALMNALMHGAVVRGFDRVVLHASSAGRPLYESLGFVPTNEMRWTPPVK